MIQTVSNAGRRFWKVTTAPTVEPLSLEELKLFARIDGSDDDAMLNGFITAVREAGEPYLGRALIEQSITLYMDEWPADSIKLPRPPLISITAVRTRDEDGTATTYDADNYYVVTASTPGELVLKFGATPPTNLDRYTAGYEVEYKAGYGATAASVPQAIKEGLKLWAASMYENRVMTLEPPPEARKLLDIFKVHRI